MVRPWIARLWALTGVVAISFSAIYVRLADVEPTAAAFFRCAYALPVLAAMWWFGRRRYRRSARAHGLAFVAGVFLGLDMALWHHAIEHIGAGLATVLGNTQVIFVGLLAWWIYRERPSRAALLGVPVVLAGVTLISGVGSAGAFGEDPALGAVFGLLTGFTYAIYILIFRAAGRELGSPAGPLLDATLGAATGAVIFSLFDGGLDVSVTWPAHGWLVVLALGSQVVGWLLIGAALPRLPVLETSVVLLLQPMLTMVWARWLFAEYLSWLQGLGMVLELAGVAWVSIRGSVAGGVAQGAASPDESQSEGSGGRTRHVGLGTRLELSTVLPLDKVE